MIDKAIYHKNIIELPLQNNEEFIRLIAKADICVVGSGAVAVQILALNKPSIMCATSKTGERYLADYEQASVTKRASLCPQTIAQQVGLLSGEKERMIQLNAMNNNQFSNDLPQTLTAIILLIEK